MKSLSAILLLFCCLVTAGPLSGLIDSTQSILDSALPEHPGFDLDLQELRLVQLHPQEEPVWLTELQKVGLQVPAPAATYLYLHDAVQIQVKAQGIKFLDM